MALKKLPMTSVFITVAALVAVLAIDVTAKSMELKVFKINSTSLIHFYIFLST